MSNSSDDTADRDPSHQLEPARALVTTGGLLAGLSHAKIAVYLELACNGPSSVVHLMKQVERSRKQLYRTVNALEHDHDLIVSYTCPGDPTTTLYRIADDTD